jgi:hypothetical protein
MLQSNLLQLVHSELVVKCVDTYNNLDMFVYDCRWIRQFNDLRVECFRLCSSCTFEVGSVNHHAHRHLNLWGYQKFRDNTWGITTHH